MWLQRTVGANNGILLGQTGPVAPGPGSPLPIPLDYDKTDFGAAPGVRLRAMQQIDQCRSWDLTYFGFQQWATDQTLAADPVGLTVLATSPFLSLTSPFGADTSISYNSSSRLHSAELNRRRDIYQTPTSQVTLIGGVRYLSFQDNLSLTAVDSIFGSETVSVSTNNNLVGGQIGGHFSRTWRSWNFGLEGKAALCGNIASQRLDDTGTTAVAPSSATSRNSTVAGILDLNLQSRFRINDQVYLRAGYQVLYVPGLSLAPAQLPAFNASSDLFMHGPSAGIEVGWGGSRR